MFKRLTEINARMAELRAQLEGTGEVDLKAIEAEIRALSEEKASIESRQALAQSIAAGEVTPAVVTPVAEQKSKDAAAEYRTLWLKTIRSGMELSDAEKRAAMTTGAASAGAAVPTETANKIIEAVTQYCPWLDKIDLYKVPGGLVIPKEGTVNDAALHTEAASITSSTDTLGKVTLGHFEITKLITKEAQ